jgi:hypothetical protein
MERAANALMVILILLQLLAGTCNNERGASELSNIVWMTGFYI